MVVLILTKLISQNRGLIYAYLYSKIIDSVVRLSQMKVPDYRILINYLIFLLLYGFVFDGLIASLNGYVRRSFRMVSRSEMDRLLFIHLHKIGIQTLEDPKTNNLLQRSSMWIYETYNVLDRLVNLISQIASVIASGIIVVKFFSIMIPIVIALSVVKFIPERFFTNKEFHWHVDNTEKMRKAQNYAWWLTNPIALQEISIIGAYKYFAKKYDEFYLWFNDGIKKILLQRGWLNIFVNTLDTFTSIIGYSSVFIAYINHQITMGTLSFRIKALDTFSNAMSDMLAEISYVNEVAVKLSDVVNLFNTKPAFADGTKTLGKLKIPPEIEFRDITFCYPGSQKPVFSNLNLKIKRGEKIAIVGHNGAGKTTLVKLIARMYVPQSGTILVNGISLADIKMSDWYENLGVLFQDYNFYGHLSAKENIYVGNTLQTNIKEEEIIDAAKNADAHNFIMDFPNRYDQILSERFEGGVRPSGGQQQKISIARFFYRNTPVVLFDEPTAAIDAVSEYNIFGKIYKFFRNKSVIIISHRFSTVRNADRIIVLDKGQIIEEGTHQILLEKDGVYAHAFKLQAEGYQH